MREIKFRGKRVENGAWVYGQYFNVKRQGFYVGIGHYILPENSVFANKVNPKTVGQYTGLKDKNGKEIYEGDIVRHKQYIKWGELSECTGTVAIDPNRGVTVGYDSIGRDIEVIGNIHDNPELLKEVE
jgi:uncharacterized phage protein (TIGR01671 family)